MPQSSDKLLISKVGPKSNANPRRRKRKGSDQVEAQYITMNQQSGITNPLKNQDTWGTSHGIVVKWKRRRSRGAEQRHRRWETSSSGGAWREGRQRLWTGASRRGAGRGERRRCWKCKQWRRCWEEASKGDERVGVGAIGEKLRQIFYGKRSRS